MKEIVLTVDNNTYDVIIGENAQDNWDIIDQSDGNDIWFHVKESSSCHVILKTNNIDIDKINKRLLYLSAVQCKMNSKSKKNNNVEIIYTQIKNIKKSDEIGSVTTKKTKTIKV